MRNFVILFLALSEAIVEFYDRSFIEFHEKYIYPDILEKTGVSKDRIYNNIIKFSILYITVFEIN